MYSDAEFTVISSAEAVDVEWGSTVDPVDIVVRTNYEAFLDAGEGLMAMDEFVANHLDIVTATPIARSSFSLSH